MANRNPPLKIELTEDYTKVEYELNGLKTERIGDLSSLLDIFKSVDTSIVLPILPIGTRRFVKKGPTVNVITYHEEAIIENFQYYEDKIKIPAPKTLMLNQATELGDGKYRLVHTTFFPIKATYLNSDDIELFYWPFPNQEGIFKGTVCWGSDPNIAILRKSCDLFNLGSCYHIYFNAKANDDYKWNFDSPELSMPSYIRGQEKFPYERLKHTGKTMKDLMKMITTDTAPINRRNGF